MLSQQLVSFGCLVATAMATCYFPDGNISGADVACKSSATDSFCCFSNQACLSNGICQTGEVDGVPQYARGTCTDPNWQSGACPNFCLDVQGGSGNVMFSCNQTGVDRYCCNDDCTCEENGVNQVVSFAGEPYTVSVIGQQGTYPNPSATPTSSSSSSSSATTTTSSSSSTISAGAGSTASSTSSPSATSSPSSSNAVPIGVGVGVGVGAALLIIAGAFFFYRRRRSRAQRRQAPVSEKRESLPTYQDSAKTQKIPSQQNDAYRPYQGNPSGNMSELPSETTQGRHELGGGDTVARELPGNYAR